MARIIVAVLILSLSGCSGFTTIKEVKVPVLVCPAPPVVKRPDLEIYKLTDEDLNDPGKVAQAIKITLVQLQSYGILLETIINTYKNTSDAYNALQQRLEHEFPRAIEDEPELPRPEVE